MVLATALTCMALNIYHESRSETGAGQHAVAQVTWNRADRDSKNVCAVVTKHRQFSWTNDKLELLDGKYVLRRAAAPKDDRAWTRAKAIAQVTLTGGVPDLLNGATFYHAKYVNPKWNKEFKLVAVIGAHKFYRKS